MNIQRQTVKKHKKKNINKLVFELIGLEFGVIVNTVKMINGELKPSYAEGDSDAYKQVSPEIMSTT